jgi:hypothetical protein
MVKLPQVIAANKALATQPIVYVGMGATSGINLFALQALVSAFASQGQQGKGLRAYIVGRKPEDGQKIIEECLKQCLKATLTYVLAADLSLLSEVDKASKEIERLERLEEQRGNGKARVDILVASPSPVLFQPRYSLRQQLGRGANISQNGNSRGHRQVYLSPLLCSHPDDHQSATTSRGLDASLRPRHLHLRSWDIRSDLPKRSHFARTRALRIQDVARSCCPHEDAGLRATCSAA